MDMAEDLAGKAAIVTGGASGIGRAMAELFVAEGAKVLIADINEEQGAAFAAELGPNAGFQRTDVSRREQVQAAVDFAVAHFGGLHIMCNNAGFPGRPIARFLDDDLQEYERILAINFMGVVYGSHCAGQHMTKNGGGSIINTASIAGVLPGFAFTCYRASKAAIINFSKSIAIDLAEYGIRVNALAPGSIKTPATDFRKPGMTEAEFRLTRAESDRVMLSYQPLKTQGRPDDVAQAALFLASDRARQITGILMPVDGGISAGDPVNHAGELMAAHERILGQMNAERR
jgi:NAD(P)-dependent dehydrogenase (short-subunit alcohol dehydrogenase family)